MNGNNFRTLYYFITLLVITVLFVVAGVYLINKDQDSKPVEQEAGDTNNIQPEAVEENSSTNQKPELSGDQQLYVQAVNEFEAKNYQAAIGSLSQAIEENPKITSYYSLKSEAEIITGQIDEAKKTLEAGIEIDPNSEILNSKLDVLNKEYFFPTSEEATRG